MDGISNGENNIEPSDSSPLSKRTACRNADARSTEPVKFEASRSSSPANPSLQPPIPPLSLLCFQVHASLQCSDTLLLEKEATGGGFHDPPDV
jgi:hypothetical protein